MRFSAAEIVHLKRKIWQYVEIDPETMCWIWRGYLSARPPKRGYGKLRVQGKYIYTHRLAFAVFSNAGYMPELFVCHKCDVTECCNPDHLFIGTPTDNMRDMWAKGRQRPGRVSGNTHYSRTHPEKLSRGEKHNKSKLTEQDVLEIRRLISAGAEHRDVGKVFGVAHSTVGRIARFENWKHVGGQNVFHDHQP